MYLLAISLPLISFLLTSCFGFYIGYKGAPFLSVILMFFSVICNFLIFYEVVVQQSICHCILYKFIEAFDLEIDLVFDPLSSIMILMVSFISTCIHFYSITYMSHDLNRTKFLSFLNIFTFFMLFLAVANNLFTIFIAWEGVGICSYLLINFWNTRTQANKAALKAVMVNKLGDIALMVIIGFLLFSPATTNFDLMNLFVTSEYFEIFKYLTIFSNFNVLTLFIITLFMIVAIMSKSAQFGLHTWLADAMEGPTPVSALIHAATMVTAGIYLLLRMTYIIEVFQDFAYLIMLIGSFTAFYTALIGCFQFDIKKIIAYSTCSQLGLIIFSCGLGNYVGGFYHLIIHAFFKALLFLSAGAVLHAYTDEQDIRKMFNFSSMIPVSYIAFLVGSIAIMGFPFMSGFYSKDFIFESGLIYPDYLLDFPFWLTLLGTFLTGLYSAKALSIFFKTDLSAKNSVSLTFVTENQWLLLFPLVLLSLLAIIIGFYSKFFFLALGNDTFLNVFYLEDNLMLELELLPVIGKNLPFFFCILGVCAYFIFVSYYQVQFSYLFFISRIFLRKLYFEEIFNKFSSKILFSSKKLYYNLLDKGWLEYFGPVYIPSIILKFSLFVQKFHTGHLNHILFFYISFIYFLLFAFFFEFFSLTFLFYVIFVFCFYFYKTANFSFLKK